jgi:Zn-dependent protease with chaperone function
MIDLIWYALLVCFGLWLAWILGNLALMLLVRHPAPAFNGFCVLVPRDIADKLTAGELEAVKAHELGHKHLWHVWENFALVCVFKRASLRRRRMQELEADEYATSHANSADLASALRKLSEDPFDQFRAARLETFSGNAAQRPEGT